MHQLMNSLRTQRNHCPLKAAVIASSDPFRNLTHRTSRNGPGNRYVKFCESSYEKDQMICNNVTGLGIVDPKALPLSDYLPFHMRYLSVIGTMMETSVY